MNLQRQGDEVAAFLAACPAYACTVDDALPLLHDALPSLRRLVERSPQLCRGEDRAVLERCLFDMATDDVDPVDAFVEFGLWLLDGCAAQGTEEFFSQLDATRLRAFFRDEVFRYSILRKRNRTTLVRKTIRSWCELEWCGRQGVLCCARCYKNANRRVLYCSRECQLKHWQTHRRTCGHNTEATLPSELQQKRECVKRVPIVEEAAIL